jgi:LysW-gamma-L-alpha-aminoadipyl-6-phosphate/LysW-L-glutamyl-5-phosphate reductase
MTGRAERPIKVAILGASGYGAGELLRLLTQHPAVEVEAVTSTTQPGQPLAVIHPHLRGFYDMVVTETVDIERLIAGEDAVVFAAQPTGKSGVAVDEFLKGIDKLDRASRVKCIDLSGDLRLKDAALHRLHYPETPELGVRRQSFVYGLPELFRDQIRGARHVANVGCLASAAILAAAPLVRQAPVRESPVQEPLVRESLLAPDAPLVIDAKTGSSGSGRQLKETTHHPTRHADFRAYKPLAHQHEPEILQALGDPRGQRLQLSFVAQSMDTARGIFVTVHAQLAAPSDSRTLSARYADFYQDSPFVRIVADSPTLQDVVGSNFCDIGVACRGRQVIVMAALDNLVKGMAGTAIQNMNLMCGLPETTGLWMPALRPV